MPRTDLDALIPRTIGRTRVWLEGRTYCSRRGCDLRYRFYIDPDDHMVRWFVEHNGKRVPREASDLTSEAGLTSLALAIRDLHSAAGLPEEPD